MVFNAGDIGSIPVTREKKIKKKTLSLVAEYYIFTVKALVRFQ